MKRSLSPAQAWALALALVLPRALLFAGAYGAHFDIDSYRLVEAAMREGRPLYGDPALLGRYPYLPAWALLLRGLGELGRAWDLPPWQLFKLPALLADAGVVLCLLRLGGARAFGAGLAYALSPLAILVSAGHGQFDSVVLLGLLLALLALREGGARAGLLSGLALSAAISFKSWPLFLLPVYVRALPGRQARHCLAAALLLPLLLLLPWALEPGADGVLGRLAYAGTNGIGLPQALLSALRAGLSPAALLRAGWALTALSAVALLLLWARAWALPRGAAPAVALAAQSLGLLVLAPALSPQYLLWPLPFLILWDRAWAWAYSAAMLIPMAAYYALCFPEALSLRWAGRETGLPAGGLGLWAWAALNLVAAAFLIVSWRRAEAAAA